MLHIISSGPGLHHNFLRFTLDYLDKDTPHIDKFPFDYSGASHNVIKYSKKYILPKTSITLEPSIKNCVGIEADDLLYFERVSFAREGSANIDIKNLNNFDTWHHWNNDTIKEIREFYNIQDIDKLPNFIVRDFYKMSYLDPVNKGLYRYNQGIIQQVRERDCKIIPVSSFFTYDAYEKCLRDIANKFQLNLDYALLPVLYQEFYERNTQLQEHHIVQEILDSVEGKKIMAIPRLDVFQEAFIYAELEKQNDFIVMPLLNNFYQNTSEIIEYIKNYPEHYKAMNPNMPKYNGIPNPYHLAKLKK